MSIINQQNNNSTQSNILYAYLVELNNCLHMEAAIFFRNRKLSVVEFVQVSELYLPLPTYVERKTRKDFRFGVAAAILPIF